MIENWYFDKQGRPISRDEWAKRFANFDWKRVARTELFGGSVMVSTVWIGLNHQFGDGPPLIFETMVFGGPLDGHDMRYSTEGQAIVGHELMVRKVKRARWEHWFPTIAKWLS